MEEEIIKNAIYPATKAFFDSLFEHYRNPFSLFKSRIHKFSKKEGGIIFAFPKEISSDSPLINDALELEEIRQINLLHHNLINDISKYKINVKRLENKQIPTNHEEAVKLLKKSRAALIIWGNVISGNVNGIRGRITEIKNLKFTYNLKDISFEDQKMLSGFIGFSMIGKKNAINHKNDKDDRDVIARNIKNTSCYILASVLTWNKRFEEAYKIFNQLENDLSTENNGSEKKVLESVSFVHSYAYFLEGQKIGLPAFPSAKNRVKIEVITKKMMEKSPYIKVQYSYEAIINFWNRNINGAINSLDHAPNNFSTDFSKAFLFYYKNEIKSGWMYLKKAIKGFDDSRKYEKDVIQIKRNKEFIEDIVKFYKDVIRKEPNNFLLLFPLSYIVYSLLDKRKSIKYLRMLLNGIDSLDLNKEEIHILKRKSQKMINYLE